MTVIDSDVIIYSAQPRREDIRAFIRAGEIFVSAVSKVEVLGFKDLSPTELAQFESFFASSTVLSVSEKVVEKAIELRRQKKIGLGDSLIAATALVHDLALLTNNTKDFRWIDSLRIIDLSDL